MTLHDPRPAAPTLNSLGFARTAAETISDMLTTAKQKIAAGGDLSSVATRETLADAINALGEQINDIVSSAALNGVNMIGTAGDPPTAVAEASYNIVGAITRIEIWDAARWEEYSTAQEADFAQMNEEVFADE